MTHLSRTPAVDKRFPDNKVKAVSINSGTDARFDASNCVRKMLVAQSALMTLGYHPPKQKEMSGKASRSVLNNYETGKKTSDNDR